MEENQIERLQPELYVEKENSKYSLIKTPISTPQILKILQKTPSNHVYKRPGKGGGQWEYVTGTYIKKVLNFCFGWMWDFEIVNQGREGDQVWVLGKLTIKDSKTFQSIIVKMQYGRADLKFKKETKTPLDFGNDLKGAATDALKKCAAELGIASDIYGKNEFREITETPVPKKDNPKTPPKTETKKVASDYLQQVKLRLNKMGANTEKQALDLLKKKTGLVWKSFKVASPVMAQRALAELLKVK